MAVLRYYEDLAAKTSKSREIKVKGKNGEEDESYFPDTKMISFNLSKRFTKAFGDKQTITHEGSEDKPARLIIDYGEKKQTD